MKKEGEKVCPVGYIMVDGKCVEDVTPSPESTVVEPVNGACPVGYILVNGKCVEDVTPPTP